MSVIDFVPEEDSASQLFGWGHHCDGDPTPTPWLIKNILPETGGALISGQWGTYKQLSSCRREIADRFGRVKAGASRPRTTCGYGLDSAKSLRATATVRSTHCADRCNGRPKPYRRGAWR